MDKIVPDSVNISFSELLKICVLGQGLPHNKGEIYFLVSTLKALGILEEISNQQYKINWQIYETLKKEGSL